MNVPSLILKRFVMGAVVLAYIVAIVAGAYVKHLSDQPKSIDLDSALDLQTLHVNTSKDTGFAEKWTTVAMFDDNSAAVIPKVEFNGDGLWFVDIKNKKVKDLKFPNIIDIANTYFYSAGDKIIVVFGAKEGSKSSFNFLNSGKSQDYVFSIGKQGEIQQLEEIDNLDKLKGKDLSGLIHVQRINSDFYYTNKYFIRYAFGTQNTTEYFKPFDKTTIVTDGVGSPSDLRQLNYKDITIKITRRTNKGDDSNGITNIDLTKNGKLIKEYRFKASYFYVFLKENTLWIVGQSVKYLDLDSL